MDYPIDHLFSTPEERTCISKRHMGVIGEQKDQILGALVLERVKK